MAKDSKGKFFRFLFFILCNFLQHTKDEISNLPHFLLWKQKKLRQSDLPGDKSFLQRVESEGVEGEGEKEKYDEKIKEEFKNIFPSSASK